LAARIVDLMTQQSEPIVRPLAGLAQRWTRALARYRDPHHGRSIFEISVTVVPFAALWAAAWAAVHFGYWELSFLFGIPAAAFLVRLFMIQHDCGHGCFFRYRLANDWTGRVLSVLTLTPYDDWRRAHAAHHASSGHLDRRGVGDIDTLTVREFQALGFWGRLRYRLYRHPLVMFGLGPAYLFVVRQRLPFRSMRGDRLTWISPMATNLSIAVAAIPLVWFIGIGPFLLVHGPIVLLAGSVGVWLFYVQHQFEETFWAREREWDFHEASLHGSSHYDLPLILRWFTANIGMHHVHHLCSRIPYYRLPQTLRDHPDLRRVSRLTLLQSFRCVHLALWDETRRRLVSFRDIRELRGSLARPRHVKT
jgi:omega-6 fatty acid desaturase (delta-12 desaturase)